PPDTLAAEPGSHDDARDLEGPFVGESRGDSDLGVRHADHLAVVLGDEHHPVVRHQGLAEPPGHLVVEARPRREHAPVALHPLELLEQRDELGLALGTRLSDLHVTPSSGLHRFFVSLPWRDCPPPQSMEVYPLSRWFAPRSPNPRPPSSLAGSRP